MLSQGLLLNLAGQLKTPFIQIARLSELGRLYKEEDQLASVETIAKAALTLLDNYILGVNLYQANYHFDNEAVSVPAVLYDARSKLGRLGEAYGVDVELLTTTKTPTVQANRQALEAALVSLGSALIEALPALQSNQLKLYLATHNSRYGIVAGIYAETKKLSDQTIKDGRRLLKQSAQPLLNLSANRGAGFFIADAICRAMDLELVASRHKSQFGIGVILKPSHQLELF